MEVEEAESAHPTPFLNLDLNGKPLFNVSTKYFSSVDIYLSKSSFDITTSTFGERDTILIAGKIWE